MISLFDGLYGREDLRDHVGDLSTVIGVKPYTLFDGPERGVLAVDAWAGDFRFTVLPDRGMNVCGASFRGIPLDWSSGTGSTSPFLYDPAGWGWLRSFHGGLVHTCGLDNVGEPAREGARSYGGHGSISNTPAREVSWGTEETEAGFTAYVAGSVRSISALEENLLLRRRVSCTLGAPSVIIEDTIRNLGSARSPVFLLYHCNFGFPILSESSTLSLPAKRAVDPSGRDVANFRAVSGPVDAPSEVVVHPLVEALGKETSVTLFNPGLGDDGLGVRLSYDAAVLPHLTVWKNFQKRTYVLAVEPGTCRVGGREAETDAGRAVFLEKDQAMHSRLELRAVTKETA
jgi:hypothetical protein